MDGSVLRPGLCIKPIINLEEAKNLVETLYGYKCLDIMELPGYDDKNFKVRVEIENPRNNTYILKVLNSFDSKKLDYVEGMNALLLFACKCYDFAELFFFSKNLLFPDKKEFMVPKPVPTVQGGYYSLETLESGRHVIRLMQYIPGSIINEVPPSAHLFFSTGVYVSKLDKALKVVFYFDKKLKKTKAEKVGWMLRRPKG